MNEIQYIRTRLGITQQVLADMLGTSRSTIAMTETEQRMLPFDACMKLAQLQVRLQEEASGYMPAESEVNIVIESDDALRTELEKSCAKLDAQLETLAEDLQQMQLRHEQYTHALESFHVHEENNTLEEFTLFLKADREELVEKWTRTRPLMQQVLRSRIDKLTLERQQCMDLLAMLSEQPHYNQFPPGVN